MTIRDIAQEAQVSVSSVSRYLHSPGMLRPEMQKRIREVIELHNYRPSHLAVSMRTRQTRNIALIIPSLTNLYYLDLYGMIRSVILKRGYRVGLYTTEKDSEALKKCLDQLPQQHYDGVIIAFLDEADSQRMLLRTQKKIPMVLITSDPAQEQINNIFLDARNAMYTATAHLISLGRHKLSFVGGSPDSVIAAEKYKGFLDALTENGLSEKMKTFSMDSGSTFPRVLMPLRPSGLRELSQMESSVPRMTSALAVSNNSCTIKWISRRKQRWCP